MIGSLWMHDRFHAIPSVLTFDLPLLVLLPDILTLAFGKVALDLRVNLIDTVP
jgi:hypothetical protein